MLTELLCTRSVMLELLWRPIPELLCTLNADKWTDYPTDRPANRPGIQGKLPVKHVQVVKQVSFPLFLWWMHSFSYVRGFPMRFFTRL